MRGKPMDVTIRRAAPRDSAAVGRICYEAFKAIADEHRFTPDFPDAESAAGLLGSLIEHPGFFVVVAESEGRVVGSNFLDERNTISGVGPITVDPGIQNTGVGRTLMDAAMRRSRDRGFPSIRLVQAGYHRRSLALYVKLGFEVREALVCLQGPAVAVAVPGCIVRPAVDADVAACNELCMRVHGFARAGELKDALSQSSARVVERAGRVTGYATPIAFFGHAVGETNDDLRALIGAAEAYPGPGFLLPAANGDVLRWCLDHGLRIVQPMTLMSMGLYQEPTGAWIPSVTY
jgi:predicted N-acetyltransferase YhbS